MIYYVVTADHSYTMGAYLVHWGEPLQSRVRIVTYDELFQMRAYPAGSYIFTDFDRLSDAERVGAGLIRDTLASGGLRTLNHPLQSLRRYDLLRTLHDAGINRFDVYRMSETAIPPRFPVILRPEWEHAVCTDLLHDAEALHNAVATFERLGYRRADLVITEFCDTSNSDGIFRKYTAWMIGGDVIPRGMNISRAWQVRTFDIVTPETNEEERDLFVREPHVPLVKPIFQRAAIEYGRMDYSMTEGVPQVWEINTNPMIMRPPTYFPPEQRQLQGLYAARIMQAFIQLDTGAPRGFSVSAPATLGSS